MSGRAAVERTASEVAVEDANSAVFSDTSPVEIAVELTVAALCNGSD